MISPNLESFSWQLVPLRELIRDAQSGFASGERASNGIVQMRMNNVTTDGNLDWTNILRVPATKNQIDKYCLSPGDILFNSTNSPELVGKTSVFNGYSEPVVFSNHFVRLRVDEIRLDPRYLARWITNLWNRRVFERLCTPWVNQAAVRKEDLLSLNILLPPLPEQKRIASILEKADRLRRQRHYALELSSTYLQSVFLEMFGDPATNPKDYEVIKLSEQINFVGGYAFKSEDFVNVGIPLIRIGTINTGSFDPSNLVYLPVSFTEIYKRFLLYPGDLVITLTGTVGKDDYANVYILDNHFSRYFLNQRVAKITVNPEVFTIEYILHVFKHPSTKKVLTNPSRGIRQANISNEDILSLYVPVPPLPLQQKFAQIVEKFERLRTQQREAERQAQHLFQTLLHQAFEGYVGLGSGIVQDEAVEDSVQASVVSSELTGSYVQLQMNY